ncbi:AraC family transcriptional regulator [Paenibacillus sp. YN15]|uniref:AraC family transcriptional regulator n=1 Tax=Paenibacillus sp. YN15 TaxID=1742774 RepID=UPI000DCBAB47|nr:AraC family transcriptional regulator [Paenibacillus sp. YN15]RAU93567.1 AraC family transcriptional regulator [Paenibacillus sp. YN15]
MHKYLTRLLTYSLLLGALPAVLIGIISYYIAAHDIKDKVNEANEQLLAQTQLRVEQTLRSMELSAMQFANSSLVQAAMDKPLTAEDFMEVRSLMTELFQLQTQTIINQAYLVNLEHNWMISHQALDTLWNHPESAEFLSYARNGRDFFWSSVNLDSIGKAPGSEEEEAPEKPADMIRLVQKIPMIPGSTTPKGLLVLQISAADIKSLLTPDNVLGTQYILDRSGSAFLSPVEEMRRYEAVNLRISSQVSRLSEEGAAGLEPVTRFFYSELTGWKAGITYRTSSLNGWTYVSVVSVADITRESSKIAWATVLASLLILAVVLLLSLLGTRHMYRPIRRLLEFSKRVAPADGRDRTGRNELELIQESLQLLSASRNQLDKEMESQTAHLKEFYMLKLFTGQMSDDEYLRKSAMYGFPAEWKSLGVLSLQIDLLPDSRFQEQDRELLLFAVNNMVVELLPPHSRFSPILLNDSQVTLLALTTDDPEAGKAMLYSFAETVRSKVEQYLKLPVSIGLSRPFAQLSGTVNAYGESLAALKARINLGTDIIVHYDDFMVRKGSGSAVYSRLKLVEEQLAQSVRELKPGKAEEELREYMGMLLDESSDRAEYHIPLLQLAMRLLEIAQEQGVPVSQVLEGEKEIQRFLRLQTREELLLWFQTRLFAPLIQLLAERNEHQYTNIAQQMADIIHSHYDKELSLESCAAMMHFHPFYLSRVFKKEMGITFSDYVAEYRMNMAKILLETTDLKIAEIGAKLQYKNNSAFIRSFRKVHGITPGQYREHAEKGGSPANDAAEGGEKP